MHEILYSTLHQNGFSNSSIKWFECFISNKRQCVNLNGDHSTFQNINCGLLQGDMLSQTLFSLVINKITSVIINSKYHLYADDLGLHSDFNVEQLHNAINSMNNEIEACNKHILDIGLKFNLSKSVAIIIGSINNIKKLNKINGQIPKIIVNNNEIEYVRSAKYLGYNINETFDETKHVDSIIKKVNFSLSKIRHTCNSIPINNKIEIYKAIICPLFDYCSILYHDYSIHGSGHNAIRLQMVQNNCIRYIFNLRKFDHITESLNKLKMFNASNRRIFLICSFVRNYVRSGRPKYLENIFKINKSITRNGANLVTLNISKVLKTRDEHILSHCACKLWNNIPENIRLLEKNGEFLNELKNHLINAQHTN